MLNALDLFSGIGGLSLSLRGYARTIAYCENNKFCQSVLLSRMHDGYLDLAPIWGDVRTLSKDHFESSIDLITGGFPCQDISSHGSQHGLAGQRSGLFYEVVRLIDDLRPSFVFLENVSNITKNGLLEVTGEIAKLRYDCRWLVISAGAVGAPHPRKRWFMLAHLNNDRRYGSGGARGKGSLCSDEGRLHSAGNPDGAHDQLKSRSLRSDRRGGEDLESWLGGATILSWEIEPKLVRVVNGVPNQVDRIKSLGNSVVPLQARRAFEILLNSSPNAGEVCEEELCPLSSTA